MIDFSCCEVEKAFKRLYGENGVHSISPIVKSYNQSFANDGKTVYYGAFANPNEVMNLTYRGMAIANTGNDILFDHVDGFLYDSFTGYEIRLKNLLSELPQPVVMVNVILDDAALNGWTEDVEVGGYALNIGNNDVPLSVFEGGTAAISNVGEVEISLDSGGTGANSSINIGIGDLTVDGGTGAYSITIYMFGFS